MNQDAPPEIRRDFDMVDIPMAGVAAYWLALHKLLGVTRKSRFSPAALADEAAHTSEPLTRLLLELLGAELEPADLRRLALARREMHLEALARKLALMRVSLLDMATGENPRKTLAKMTAHFTAPPLDEDKAFGYAQQLVALASSKDWSAKASYFNVEHRLKDDKLLVALLFHASWVRREGKTACRPFFPHIRSQFYLQGLALVSDGFDAPFLRKRLKVHQQALLADVMRKQDCAIELAEGIKRRWSHETCFTAAKAWLE